MFSCNCPSQVPNHIERDQVIDSRLEAQEREENPYFSTALKVAAFVVGAALFGTVFIIAGAIPAAIVAVVVLPVIFCVFLCNTSESHTRSNQVFIPWHQRLTSWISNHSRRRPPNPVVRGGRTFFMNNPSNVQVGRGHMRQPPNNPPQNQGGNVNVGGGHMRQPPNNPPNVQVGRGHFRN